MNKEKGGLVEGYKNLNKLSMIGGLGVAFAGAIFAPALVVPGLAWAAIDAGQIYLIDKWQNRKNKPQTMIQGKVINLADYKKTRVQAAKAA